MSPISITADMNGPFANQQFGAADGLAIDMTTFEATSSDGNTVSGAQFSYGIGEGVNLGTTVTNTTVFGTVTLPDSYWSDPGTWEASGE